MPKVSVIMPVYNVQPYLLESLKSVAAQTFKDIEVICVDDGSTDGSGNMLDKFAATDTRFTVIHKQNGGVSSAKNAGLEQATGDYIVFFDSDDLMELNACTRIIEVFDETSSDIVGFGGKPYPEDAGYVWLNDVLDTRDATYENFDIAVLMKEKTRPFAWRTACRRDFLITNNIRYSENLRYGEDQAFQFAVFPRSSKTTLISDKLINYRVIRNDSFMFDSHRDGDGRIREHIKVVDAVLADWDKLGLLEQYQQEMFDWIIEFLMRDLLTRTSTDEQPRASRALRDVWNNYYSEAFLITQLKNKYYGPMVKMVIQNASVPSKLHATYMDLRYSIRRLGFPHVIRRIKELTTRS